MVDFTTVFETYHAPIVRYLVRLTGDPDLAADAAQEAFVRLNQKPPVDRGQLKSWLYRVATNYALDTMRVANRRAEIIAESPTDIVDQRPKIPDVEIEKAERRAVVQAALEALRPKEKAVLLMRGQGFSYREIADTLGLPVNSIGATGARALRKLATLLAPQEALLS